MTHVQYLLMAVWCAFSASAFAQTRCELNGESIATDFSPQLLAGKSGVIRCTEAGRVSTEETYRNGVQVRAIRYRLPYGIAAETVIEGGLRKFKSYDKLGRLESESEVAVDAAGNERIPKRESMKVYRNGKLRAHVRRNGELEAEDWWNENGKKVLAVSSTSAIKEGLSLAVIRTRIFDAEGHPLYETRTHKLIKASAVQRQGPSAQGDAPKQHRLRYRPVVECISAGGKTFWMLGRCPASAAGAPVRQAKHEPRQTPANWKEIKSRWQVKEEQLMAWEMSCAKGNSGVCGVLETMRYETPASMDLKGRELDKMCHRGERLACEGLVQREEHFNEAMRRCEEGSQEMCRRLSNLAQ